MRNRKAQMVDMFDKICEELKTSEIDAVIRNKNWALLMQLTADEFNSISAAAHSESDVATKMDATILQMSTLVFARSGLKEFELDKERAVSLRKNATDESGAVRIVLSKGRIDSKFASFLIEYKQPSAYKTKADTNKALEQALDYLNSLYEEHASSYLACVTDGSRCQFVAFNEQIKALYDTDKRTITPITAVKPLDAEMASEIFKAIISCQVKALTAENLKKDIVTEKHKGKTIIQQLTRALYDSLKNMNRITAVSYQQWMNNFGLSHDDISKQKAIEDRRKDLAAIIDKKRIETDEEYKILFSLQTAIAILAMLMAYRVVLLVKGSRSESFKGLVEMGMEELRIELKKIAEGTTSISMNIFNLLELGCFSWPFQEAYWTEEINGCIKNLVETLMAYETIPDLTEHTDDLFRDLYMSIMPVSVRHSLGEYYTPRWLAENVILDGKDHLPFDKENIRVLDSTAGSGTFPQIVINAKRQRYLGDGMSKKDALKKITSEVVAIDANTLAVILARINYFLAIANLVDPFDDIYIPVFIGDSSVPSINKVSEDGKYYIETVQIENGEKISVKVPVSAVHRQQDFVSSLQGLSLIDNVDEEALRHQLDRICTNSVELNEIAPSWIDLKDKGLITPAVVGSLINNFLLCNIGKFDLIVGNPPWVDWKSLPSVHRENKKDICYSRKLFSGDGRTGGNSLNICALISNISAENWLAEGGVMAILMPQSLLFQQSYEGYREFNLIDGRKLYFQKIVDWSKAGHPFYPVQQLFCTYVISEDKQDYEAGIPLKQVSIKRGYKIESIKEKITADTFNMFFAITDGVAGKASSSRSAFTFAGSKAELSAFNAITGTTSYLGREGVELYPQELQLLIPMESNEDKSEVVLSNYQSTKSKISVGKQTVILESKFLRPLVKGLDISRFHIEPSKYVVAFPYDRDHEQIPLRAEELLAESPKLLRYYAANKDYLTAQTEYSDKIIGSKNTEYYALARTGRYCHADWYVIFRDNTKWVAAVTGKIETDWGGKKIPAFQNHCVSICEGPNGAMITEEEAHYICAILNSHLVEDYVLSTSDKRTFKIRVPVRVPAFDAQNEGHKRLAQLSMQAHKYYDDGEKVEAIRTAIDQLYLTILSEEGGSE